MSDTMSLSNGEWKEYKLGELGTVITGKTPSKNNPEDWGSAMPFVTPSDYKNYGKFAKKAERNLSKIGTERLRSKVLPSKSILVTCIGSDMGKVAINSNQVITNQQINSIIPNQNADSDFLYYRLVSMYETFRTYAAAGTAVPIVNKGDFENIKTEVPPLPEQTAIASVLSSLDDKIDLLHRQNATLEKMAETLFRRWFVEETNEEWEEGKLSDLVVIKYGKDHKNLLVGNIPVFGSGGHMRYAEKFLYNKESVLIPRKGSLNNVIYCDEPFWTVDTMFYTEMKKPNIAKFIFYFVKGIDLASMNVGSAVPSMTAELLNNLLINIPSEDALEKFEYAVVPFYKKKKFNQTQIRTLTALRDTLLPKLMSGEVRVELEK